MAADPNARARRERAKELLLDAIEVDPTERDRWLEQVCGADQDLLAELTRLLAAHDAAGAFLAEPTRPDGVGDPAPSSESDSIDSPGTRIGPYELLESLGEGGFGVVYRARQHSPIQREVALKILRWTATSDRVLARFEQERQTLAAMDHPHVAHIFDAGRTDDGRPFFAMELVDGPPVTTYCDRRSLTIEERLRLFVEICRAVQHAHEKGIVHRDLKPSNILVTERAERPIPKVIDFGIAKVTEVASGVAAIHTEAGVLIGSLESMSPEQAERGAVAVDTRSDVYSLGVLLYEILCGSRPFDFDAVGEIGLSEILRRIGQIDPPAPSRRVISDPSASVGIAADRAVTSSRLARALRGDLDQIVARAIAKDRDRRYVSPEDLAIDIERFLRGEPVQAAPPRAVYRLRKLIRRHRAASALLALLAVALVLGTALLAWQAQRLARARDLADRQVVLRTAEAAALRSAVLEGVDDYVGRAKRAIGLARTDPGLPPGEFALRLVNTLQILDLYESFGDMTPDALVFRDEVERESLQQIRVAKAEVDSSLLRTLDLLMDHFAKRAPARLEGALRLSVEITTAGSSIDPDRAVAARRQLAQWLLRQSRSDLAQGGHVRAEVRAQESADLWRHVHPDGSIQEHQAAGVLGRSLVAQGRFNEAEPHLRRSQASQPSIATARALAELLHAKGMEAAAREVESHIPVVTARELGPVSMPVSIGGCDLGFSASFGGRSVWVFGDTFTSAGRPEGSWRSVTNSWAWTELGTASPPLRLQFALTTDGVPRALIPLQPEEALQPGRDGASVRAERIALWPEAIVRGPAAEQRLIAYSKVLLGPEGGLDLQTLGSGWALWDQPDSSARRPELRPRTPEPTLLFQAPEPAFGPGALVHDGKLYAFAVSCADLRCPTLLARVDLDQWARREAWEFFTADERWSARWEDAAEVMTSAPQLSVYWNAFVGRFVAVYATPLEGTIEVRQAAALEGPWSAPWRVLEAVEPPSLDAWSYAVIAHPELSEQGGRRDLVSYYRPLGGVTGEIRLVELWWSPAAPPSIPNASGE